MSEGGDHQCSKEGKKGCDRDDGESGVGRVIGDMIGGWYRWAGDDASVSTSQPPGRFG